MRRQPILILATIGLFTALFAIATNVATSTLATSMPADWKLRIPLIAWSVVGISILLLIGLPIRQYLQDHAATRSEISSAERSHNRSRMLAKVRATWMPLLDESLQEIVRIELGLTSTAALVDDPRKCLRQPNRPERLLPPGTPIHAVFDDLAGELLILGAPGAGKTTMLLELTRELLNRAQHDAAQPIPVVFNLRLGPCRRSQSGWWTN